MRFLLPRNLLGCDDYQKRQINFRSLFLLQSEPAGRSSPKVYPPSCCLDRPRSFFFGYFVGTYNLLVLGWTSMGKLLHSSLLIIVYIASSCPDKDFLPLNLNLYSSTTLLPSNYPRIQTRMTNGYKDSLDRIIH